MAIPITKFVDIATTFPASNPAQRSFGGLLFTKTEMVNVTGDADLAAIKTQYDAGEIVYLSLGQIEKLFDPNGGTLNPTPDPSDSDSSDDPEQYGYQSDEYRFAAKYYSYLSPFGRTPSRLGLVKWTGTPISAFQSVIDKTNNFGSFTFLDKNGQTPTAIASLVEVAAFNESLNGKFWFIVNDVRGTQSYADVIAKATQFKDIAGTCFVSGKDILSGYMPMSLFAATDYTSGTAIVHMFKQFGNEEPTVTSESVYEAFNAAHVNFYGRTQTNGQQIDFYQRGYNTDGVDSAVYCNELWLKSYCESLLMNLLMSTNRVPANNDGVAMVSVELMQACGMAVNNNVFSIKTLSASDERTVRMLLSNIPTATVQDADDIISGLNRLGYAQFVYLDQSESGEYYIHYYLFYGTADSIRYIKGDDILIK